MEQTRPVTRPMRILLWVSSFFVFVAGVQLYVLSSSTEDWFAWTIEPPLTAAFIGAFYFAACVLTLGSLTETAWDRIRVFAPGVLAFVTLIALATLIHLDKFHLDDGELTPAAAAWVWLVVYLVEPPALAWLFWRQQREPGVDAPCDAAMSTWFARASIGVGAALTLVGAILFISPETADELWPWPLTPLTARAVGATLVGEGLVAVSIGRERCWGRVRWALSGLLALAVLLAIALVRYEETFDAGGGAGVIFLAMLALVGAGCLYGVLAARRARLAGD